MRQRCIHSCCWYRIPTFPIPIISEGFYLIPRKSPTHLIPEIWTLRQWDIFYICIYINIIISHFDYSSEYFFAGLTFQTREGTKVQISQMIWSTEFSIRGTASLECLQYLVPTLLSLDQRVYNPFDVLDHSLFVLRHECPQHKTPKSQKSILLIKL